MIGVDIVEVGRIAGVLERFGRRFLDKVFTPFELEQVEGRKRFAESLAGKFAAKEAFMKAMGRRLAWKEIEVVSTGGRPYITYRRVSFGGLSIAHERAFVVSVMTLPDEVVP